jgi:predicted ester cyclase
MKKQNFIAVLALATALFALSCNNDKKDEASEKKPDVQSNAERNKQNVLKAFDAINAKDLNGFMSYCSANIVDHDPGVNGKAYKGSDSVKANFQSILTAFPDLKITPTHTLADGDMVAVFNNFTGTWKGDLMGMKPTGKSFSLNDADLFIMDASGKIVEHWPTQEMAAMGQQIGMPQPK